MMQYIEHVNDDGDIIKVRMSFSNERLEGETRQEYLFRRSFMKEQVKQYKKGKRVK
jgi:hypothetical protein